MYVVKPNGQQGGWKITETGNGIEVTVGNVEQLATGYLVTLAKDNQKIKRFRMIDALKEALGELARITIEPTGATA